MGFIRNYLVGTIENSLENIPGEKQTAVMKDEMPGLFLKVDWALSTDKLDLKLTVNTVGSGQERRLTLLRDQQSGCLSHLDFQQTTHFSERDPRQKQFVGRISEISLIKLGKAALTLKKAVKTIADSESRLT